MNNLTIIAALALGFLLGIFFFGGLWFTVKKALEIKRPAWWVFGSFMVRMGITLSGFYFISMHGWQYLLFCLAGFIIARYVVMRWTKMKHIKAPG